MKLQFDLVFAGQKEPQAIISLALRNKWAIWKAINIFDCI